MQSVDLNTPLFYQFRGFDRDGFISSANLAQQRFRQLQEEADAELEADIQATETNVRQNTNANQILLVSPFLSVPRSLSSPRLTELQFTPPPPNYQQSTPSFAASSRTSINIYA